MPRICPARSTTRAGERFTLTLTWTHPRGWRELDHVDLRLRDEQGIPLWVRFTEQAGNTSTLSLLDANGRPIATGVPGRAGVLASSTARLYLQQSSVTGSGPAGRNVTAVFSLSLNGAAAGRVYAVELLARDDDGTTQGPEVAGILTVGPFRVALPLVIQGR